MRDEQNKKLQLFHCCNQAKKKNQIQFFNNFCVNASKILVVGRYFYLGHSQMTKIQCFNIMKELNQLIAPSWIIMLFEGNLFVSRINPLLWTPLSTVLHELANRRTETTLFNQEYNGIKRSKLFWISFKLILNIF